AASITAPSAHRLTARGDIGDTTMPFLSRARWCGHQCCSSAMRARASSTIWILSGFDKVSLRGGSRDGKPWEVVDVPKEARCWKHWASGMRIGAAGLWEGRG